MSDSAIDRIRKATRERVDSLNDYVRALDEHYAAEGHDGRKGHMLSQTWITDCLTVIEHDTRGDERNGVSED